MAIDVRALLDSRGEQVFDLYAEHVNPQFVKVLRTIGFDRDYVRAEGPYLFDREGRRVTDFLSGYGVFNMGRNHPEIVAALKQALDLALPNLVQMGCSRLAPLLAEALKKRAPAGLDKVFFTNSGTEAVEAAIKFARAATGRAAILSWDHGFHGLSTGSLALNGNAEFRDGFGELLPGARRIPFDDLGALERELKRGDVAALVCEPIQGKGVYIPSPGFFKAAKALLAKHGALLVADEVQTGFGRTGRFFAYEHFDVEPDMVTCAKALSGGFLPVGAILYPGRVYDKVFSRMDRCVVHSTTFGKNELSMVAGLATLDVFEREGLVERSARLGELLLSGLRDLARRQPVIRDVRGKGLMIGIEFGPPPGILGRLKQVALDRIEKGLFAQTVVMTLLRDHGFLTQVAGHRIDVVKLLPPLVISEEDARGFLAALEQTLAAASVSGAMWDMALSLSKHALASR